MYAVIQYKWHQYIVKSWDVITVDNVWEKQWSKISVNDVLAVFDEEWKEVSLWVPYIANSSVSFKVLENKKWDKIRVLKFKNKTRSQKVRWFRPHQSVLQVESIKVNG